MTEQELKGYAETLILEHATDIEYLTISEMAEGYFEGEEVDDDDLRKVDDLISKATVIVTWDN